MERMVSDIYLVVVGGRLEFEGQHRGFKENVVFSMNSPGVLWNGIRFCMTAYGVLRNSTSFW